MSRSLTYNEELAIIKEPFLKKFREKHYTESEINNILDEAVLLYEEIDKLNNDFHKLNRTVSVDKNNVWFIICDIWDAGLKNKYNSSDEEKQKVELSRKLYEKVLAHKKPHIVILEPHHDDALGSASSFLFDRQNRVTVYTLAKSDDDRDEVNLHEIRKKSSKTHRQTAVFNHNKKELKDFDYNDRYEIKKSKNPESYKELIEYYKNDSHQDTDLKERLDYIIKSEKANQDEQEAKKGSNELYYVVPLGLQHPMHVLTTYYAVEAAKHTNQQNRILFYIDHPYDMKVGIDRIKEAKNYYEKELGIDLVRMDSIEINPKDVGELVKEVYKITEVDENGNAKDSYKHYGEFEGTLEKTCCSYLVPETIADNVAKKYHLHINNILFTTYQVKPFTKSGGLGEVAYTYTKELSRHVNQAAIITPKQIECMKNLPYPLVEKEKDCYYSLTVSEDGTYIRGNDCFSEPPKDAIVYIKDDDETHPYNIYLEGKDSRYKCIIEKYDWNDVRYYLVSIDGLFNSKNIFDNDNILTEIAAFSKAVIESTTGYLDFEPTVIHCNDYQTALIPFLLKYQNDLIYDRINTVYTIHSYGFRGIFSKKDLLRLLSISKNTCEYCMICEEESNEDCIFRKMNAYSKEDINKLGIPDDKVSLMKIGICFADAVTTVSEGYAKQISRYPDFKGIKKVHGIRNGITIPEKIYYSKDGEEYKNLYLIDMNSTETDPYMLFSSKQNNKRIFQKEHGLTIDDSIPLFIMTSRLNSAKGIEDIKNIFDKLMKENLQLAIIGDDDKNVIQNNKHMFAPYADFFRNKMNQYDGQFYYSNFEEEEEYKAYLAGDILIMPSRDEACGTSQMLAMKHGVIPIVNMIPAFNDTIIDYYQANSNKDNKKYVSKPSLEKGVGFYSFSDDCWILLDVIKKVIEKYHDDREKWYKVMNSNQSVDFSWNNYSMVKYLRLYNGLEKH